MCNLTTTWLGMTLKNPIVCSSSPLSEDLDAIRQMEDAGAAAVVLHSLFEEQIEIESLGLDHRLNHWNDSFAEALTYFPDMDNFRIGPDEYLNHIQRAREAVDIPIIASLNGISRGGWLRYAELMQQSGASALELNLYDIPTDPNCSSEQLELQYVELVKELAERISIPLAVKLSPFFTSPVSVGRRLTDAGARGLVLFNRFYQPDIDIEHLEVVPRLHFSQSNELPLRLHWTAILFDHVSADLGITGGVHNSHDVIKCMLVGARVAMMTSALLTHGIGIIRGILQETNRWLDDHDYRSVQQMQGSMSLHSIASPHAYERGNYMKVLKSCIIRPDKG